MEVKGSAVVVLPEFIKNNFGQQNFKTWLNSLSKEANEVYRSRILVSAWYPLETIFTEPTRKMCNMFYNRDLKGAWEVGRFSAEYAVRGVYKIFVRIATPQALTKRASQILTTYYRPCSIKAKKILKKKETIIRITKFPEMNKIIENRILGWIERTLEICGYKNIDINVVRSLNRGDSISEFKINWS